MAYEKRSSFQERIDKLDETTKRYYDEICEKFSMYKKVKARVSLRCCSFRVQGNLIAKISLGGKSLKLYLAIDPNSQELKDGKNHPRDLSSTKAYEEVPTMFPIKSELAVRKACQVIDMMMRK